MIGTAVFALYLVLLTWIILFKLQFRLSDIDSGRSINLIPFYYSTSVGGKLHFKEVWNNILIFVPFGVFLSMLASRMKLRIKILIIFGISLFFEMMQYILAIGMTDITDVMTNVFGGIIGIELYEFLLKIVKDRQKTDTLITAAAGIIAALFLALMTVLLLFN